MRMKEKERVLRNLNDARKDRHEQFAQNLKSLGTELKPARLLDRFSDAARKKAGDAGDAIADKAKSNPAEALAIGSAVFAAILYRPAKSLISRFGNDSDTAEDYEEE